MQVSFTILAAVASTASAHATWQAFWVGSEDQAGNCVRTVQDNSPITSVADATMACGRGPEASTGICTAAAGSPVSVEMHQQPGQRECSNEAIGGNHFGPVYVYMAKVDDATAADGASASFFKVAEDTYAGTDESWGTELLNANCGKKTFTIPADLAAGDYLVRSEAIALHAGPGQQQNYVSCFQVKVTGGGSAAPEGVNFPGAYSASDALFQTSIYNSGYQFTNVGPAVYTG